LDIREQSREEDRMDERLGRRQFLRLSAMAAAGAAVVACQPQTVVVKETVEVEKVVKETVEVEKEVTKVVEKEVTKVVEKEKVVKETVEVARVSERQSPMFQELVIAGELPPLEERLPVVPATCVDVPADEIDLEIGKHGGACRMTHTGPQSDPYVFCMNNESLLRGPGLTGDDLQGNICKGFQVTDNATVFTFYMREGLKWSDGEPLTTEDVRFAYEDCLMNTDITPGFPQWMRSANKPTGEPMKLDVMDDYTFRIVFAETYGGFPVQVAINGWRGYFELIKPLHYAQQYHVKYTPLDKLEPLIQEAGFEKGEWGRLFNAKNPSQWDFYQARFLGFPKLNPWITSDPTTQAIIMERNPYYFKVDAEGNQLPYMDKINSQLVQDAQIAVMKIISGEVDFVSGGAQGAAVKDIPVLKENEAKGGYNVVLQDMHVTPVDIYINHTHEDPVWRQLVRDVRFRQALNYAINRQEIIEAIYNGFADPAQESADGTYDPDKANQLLDEMGLNKRDADGFRLGPDGNAFEIPFESGGQAPDISPVTEMLVEFWKEVGVNASMKTIEGGLWAERNAANELKATVYWGLLQNVWWASWSANANLWGRLWWQWISSGGEQGEEPPEEVKRFHELMDEVYVVSPDERKVMHKEYVQLLHDNLFFIVIVENAKYPTVASKKMGNVPHSGFAINASFSGEQFFYREL
jgi:peptide/nickel transport system substrate-binding protein